MKPDGAAGYGESRAPAVKQVRRRRNRGVTGLVWVLTLLVAPFAAAWMFSGLAWVIDLAANLGAQFLLLTLIVLLIAVSTRRWRAAGVLMLCCGMHLWPLCTGRNAILPRSLAPGDAPREADVVRILHYNDATKSPLDDTESLLESSKADVVHLMCPSVPAQMAYMVRDGLRESYVGVIKRSWEAEPDSPETRITGGIVASRWPITRVDVSAVAPMADRLLAGIVERPAGRFAVISVHPRSPRSAERWLEGNGVTRAVAAVSKRFRSEGLPVLVLTDLNSTPTGYRSRLLYGDAGLYRCKPLMVLDGTHPHQVPKSLNADSPKLFTTRWPIRIAIDDVLTSPRMDVLGWEVQPRLMSEHSPIILELRVPISDAGASRENTSGR